VHSRPAAPGLGAPWRIEELYKAVLSEQGKPWGEMRREVRQRIIDVEQAVREATELHLNDSDNELAVQRFRHQFREHVRVARECARPIVVGRHYESTRRMATSAAGASPATRVSAVVASPKSVFVCSTPNTQPPSLSQE
jgi:hypothetical protein